MKTFKVKSPDGRTVTLRGETTPSDSDLDEIFSSLPMPKVNQKPMASMTDFAIAGAPGYSLMPGGEDILPAVGQTMGSLIPGMSYPGSVAGATIGRGAQKTIQGIRQGKPSVMPVMDYAPDLAKEAAGTAAIEGIFRGGGKLLMPVANRLMLSILKPSREVLKRNPNLGIQALEQGIYGTEKGMLKKSENLINKSESQLMPLIKGRPQRVVSQNAVNELKDLKRMYANVNDKNALSAIYEVEELFKNKPDLSLEEANQLKRDLYKVLKSSQYGKAQGEIPVKADARKDIAYGLSKEIKGAIPEAGPLLKKESIGINVRESLENRIADRSKTNIPRFSLMDAALFGAPTIAGNPLLGLMGVAASKFAGTPNAKSTLAKALTSKTAGMAGALSVSQLLRSLIGKEKTNNYGNY